MTLLEKAKAAPLPIRKSRDVISDDRIELAVAWLAGEVAWPQVKIALELTPGSKSSNAGQYLGPALREAFRRGMLVRGK